MNVERVDLLHLSLPLKSPFETSLGRMTEKQVFILQAQSNGVVGYAECVASTEPLYNEETLGTVKHMLEQFLIPSLFKHSVSIPEDVHMLFAPIRRNYMAKSALESALWDLYCKQQGIPLAKALGGTKSEIEVGVSIGIEASIEEVLHKVETYLGEGYRKIKVKIKPGFDVALIDSIRSKFGSDIPLMADANSAYTLKDIDILKELDNYNLMMIEQPLAHDDIIDHATLQKELKTSICLDESIHSVKDARKAIELESCRIINIKIGRVGGLFEAKKIHDLCQQYNIPVWCGGMLETGIGRAHNIALTSLHNFTIPGDTSASDRYWQEDIVEPAVSCIRPGILAVPSIPGIGYDINENTLNKYLIRREVYKKSDYM
jgi:O-succinylbenzoate synthase